MIRLVDKESRLRYLESNVEHLLHSSELGLRSDKARAHLRQGLRARHYILRYCREYIESKCFKALDGPLGPNTATEAALHLNGYYLNLRGAIDNIAWVLQFELNIIDDVADVDSRNRMKIYLFGNKFLRNLENRFPQIAQNVKAMEPWASGLASFRDPAAHRIPLYVPPGVLTSKEEVEEFQRLDALAGAPEEELKGRRRIELIEEAQRVSKFKPVFCVGASEGVRVYSIPRQLIYDHRHYLHLVRKM